MSKDKDIRPEPSPDFTVVAVDGAYIQIADGVAKLQFYRDIAFPAFDQYGIMDFSNKERTIRHEVRLGVQAAERLNSELQRGLQAYQREVDDKNGISKLIEAAKFLHGTDSTAEKEFQPIYSRLINMMRKLTPEGQRQVVDLLDQILMENEPKFEKIRTAHSIRLR